MEFPQKLYLLDEFTPIELFMDLGELKQYVSEIGYYLLQGGNCPDSKTAIAKFIAERETAELIEVDGETAYYLLSSGVYCAVQELGQYYSWHPYTDCESYGTLESAIEAVEDGLLS